MLRLKKTTTLAGLTILLMLLAVSSAVAIQSDYAEDVAIQSDPSPSIAESKINDYINQKDQINLTPDDGIVRVLRVDQKALVNDFVTAVINLKNASPRELRGLAKIICGKEGGDSDTLWVREDPKTGKPYATWQERGKNLVVVCPQYLLPYLEKTFSAIDKEWVNDTADGSWRYYYKAKNRDAGDIMNIIRYYRTPDQKFVLDQVNNAVMIFDQPCIAPLVIKQGLVEVDIPPSMINLDVEIYEVDNQDDLNLGIDFEDWKNGPGQNLFRFVLWDRRSRTWQVGNEPQIHNWGDFRSYNFLATTAYVDFMRSKGKAKLLKKAALATKSGTVGTVEILEPVTYFRTETTPVQPSVVDALVPGVIRAELPDLARRTVTIRQADDHAGIYLRIQPVVGLDSGEIKVDLEVSDVSGHTPAGAPIIETRSFSSSIQVAKDTPFVLGGITKKTKVEETNGIPYLCGIPGVGKYIFGHTTKVDRQMELVVILKPKFEVYSMQDSNPPEPIATAQKLAKGERTLGIPATDFGFDQWLLD